jgi:type IV pilus assembly protein PilM
MKKKIDILAYLSPFTFIISTGLEKSLSYIKIASLSCSKGQINLTALTQIPIESWSSTENSSSVLTTGLESRDVIIRSLSLPLKKDKDIDAALPFQAENLIPYSIDQAVLSWNRIEKKDDSSEINFFSVKKDRLEKHLESWQLLKIEPEIISTESMAFVRFLEFYSSNIEPCFIIHITETSTSCCLIVRNNIIASHSLSEGLLNLTPDSPSEAFKPILLGITKMIYALSKEHKGDPITLGLVTGDAVFYPFLVDSIYKQLNLREPEPLPLNFSKQELLNFAIPIGLAINAIDPHPLNFRQHEFVYPHPLKHIKFPLGIYLGLMIILSLVFYFFGQLYLHHQENQLKQEYVEILAEMNKSYDSFEKTFLVKNPAAREKYNDNLPGISELNRDELIERINFLQNELTSAPDSFPLFANIPRVSDVLAWLSTHPKAIGDNNDPRMQIEYFNYVMVKRPVHGKKQEKYQVKVELEFTSPSPTYAREFHDALIAPNDFVDPKAEVKWNSNRGKYTTSFFLKDKTQYPGQ